MRKLGIVLVLAMLLTGCAEQTVYEPVEDVYQVIAPPAARLLLELPQDAAVLTMGNTLGDIYFCDGYILTVQTLVGGDLDDTLRAVTGYGRDALTVLETGRRDHRLYQCVWTSAGEGGDQVGRLVLLDDGIWHYVVTVMADAARAGELALAWDTLFDTVSLERTGS